jgi:hypothetical protein
MEASMHHLILFVKKIITIPDWLPDVDVSEHPEWRGTTKGLWIEPGILLTLINGWQIAQWAIALSDRLQPRLPSGKRAGRKQTYTDATVLLSVIVMRIWRKGYESFSGWLGRNPILAANLGYTVYNAQGQLQTISSSHLSRRARQLGFWPFLFFFIGLVWQLIRLGAITGRDLIVDASILKAWYHHDREAGWSYPTRWGGSIFGYKIHTLLCRHEVLPVFFWITPANAADGPWAIPLLAAALVLYGFQIQIVRADAAYFTKKILCFIYHYLHADPVVDYNVRRNNKQVVTLEFMVAWEGLMAPRSNCDKSQITSQGKEGFQA